MRRRLRALILTSGAVAAIGIGIVASQENFRWRLSILADKATGQLKDIGWTDLAWMLRPGSGVYLGRLAETRNPFAVIQSPRSSSNDVEAGKHLFAEHCASCHGEGAAGGAGGPALIGRTLRDGQSDWALYRTITLGVPGTGMVGWQLPRDDIWRLVSYLGRTLAAHNAPGTPNGATPQARIEPVATNDIRDAPDHPAEWLTYSGSYQATRYSRLSQINRDNIGHLRVAWARQFETSADRVETTPLVRGSTMFVTEAPNRVHALDAASGRVIWSYPRDLPSRLFLCCAVANRGVALLGDRLFVGTLDAHLLALDANTGKLLWDVDVADHAEGYSITGAPLVVDDMVVTGIAGGEFGVRGFIDAYDAATGKRRWRFYTVPAPGEPGSESWAGDSASHGGATTWLTGAFDPQTRVIYWGVGNPSPNFYGEDRKGDNLYSDSVVALDADTGKLRWHFQFTPHDVHDWDAVQIPVLVDTVIGNAPRKLLVSANRNGFYYVLDRTTGEFLRGRPFVKQTWADGLDASGRPDRAAGIDTEPPRGAGLSGGLRGNKLGIAIIRPDLGPGLCADDQPRQHLLRLARTTCGP